MRAMMPIPENLSTRSCSVMVEGRPDTYTRLLTQSSVHSFPLQGKKKKNSEVDNNNFFRDYVRHSYKERSVMLH